jgi:hypothetical protein
MFKVRNGTGGSLGLSLENGGTILRASQSLDLDGICSREWLATNPVLQRLLASGALMLVHDSEQEIPQQIATDVVGFRPKPTKSAVIAPQKVVNKKIEEPIIIDFSDVGDVENEEPIPKQEFVKEILKEVDEPKKEEVKKVKKVSLKKIEKPKVEKPKVEKPKVDESKCSICGKVCSSPRGVKIHMRVHED